VALPHIVVIDDSEAILAFTRSVLSPHFAVSTAKDGREGIDLVTRLKPQAVLLDLSMPVMDGEQVLTHFKETPELQAIPVIIVSSERARAEACLARGATAFLIKPVRADELIALVGKSLDAARVRATRGSVTVLPLGVGELELAVPLSEVRHVILQPATLPLPGGPSYLTSFFELLGECVCVLDLASRLGVDHSEALLERKLVVVERDGLKLALCADRVRDPEEIAPTDVRGIVPDSAPGEFDIGAAFQAVVKTSRGPVPLIRPHALLSRGVVRSVPELLRVAAS
jgi:CheY-like chemotaxis protein